MTGAVAEGNQRVKETETPLILNRHSAGDESEPPSEEWLLTYCDTVTLLITFFVLLIMQASFTEPNVGDGIMDGFFGIAPQRESIVGEAVEAPAGAVEDGREQITSQEAPTQSAEPAGPAPVVGAEVWAEITRLKQELATRSTDQNADLRAGRERLFEQIGNEIEEIGLIDQVTPVMSGEGISLRVSNSVLFPTAEAVLSAEGSQVVRSLLPILTGKPFAIEIEGHTDSVPISTYDFPSNWHLSAIRAISVLQVLESAGIDPQRLHAVGYGETRPIADNRDLEGRSLNRRVEILLKY